MFNTCILPSQARRRAVDRTHKHRPPRPAKLGAVSSRRQRAPSRAARALVLISLNTVDDGHQQRDEDVELRKLLEHVVLPRLVRLHVVVDCARRATLDEHRRGRRVDARAARTDDAQDAHEQSGDELQRGAVAAEKDEDARERHLAEALEHLPPRPLNGVCTTSRRKELSGRFRSPIARALGGARLEARRRRCGEAVL